MPLVVGCFVAFSVLSALFANVGSASVTIDPFVRFSDVPHTNGMLESSGAHYMNETHLFVYEARGAPASHADLSFGERHPDVLPPRNETGHILEVGASAMVGGLRADAPPPRPGSVVLLGEGHERHAAVVNHVVEADGTMHVTRVDTSHAFEWVHIRIRMGVHEDHPDMPANANLTREAKRLAFSTTLPDGEDPLAVDLDWSNFKFPLTYLTPGIDSYCGDCRLRVVPVFELDFELSFAWFKPVLNRARLVVGAQVDMGFSNHLVLSGLTSLVYAGVPFPKQFTLGPPTGWTFPLGPIPINIRPVLSFGAVSILQVTGYLEMDLGFRMGGEVAVGFEYRRGEGMSFISESRAPSKPSYFDPIAHVEVAPPYKRTMTRVLVAGEIVLTIHLWNFISPLVAIRPLQLTAAWHHQSDRCPNNGGAFSVSAGTAAYCGLGLFGGVKAAGLSFGSLAYAQGLPSGAAGQMHPSQELMHECLPQDGVFPESLSPEEYAAAREAYFNEHPRGAWEPEPIDISDPKGLRRMSESVPSSTNYPPIPAPYQTALRLATYGDSEWVPVDGGLQVNVAVAQSPGPLDAHVRFCLPAGADVEVPPSLEAALAELGERLYGSDLESAGVDLDEVDPSYEPSATACQGLRTPYLSGEAVGLVDEDGATLAPPRSSVALPEENGGGFTHGSVVLRPSRISSLLHAAHGQVQVQLIVSAAFDESIAVHSSWLTTDALHAEPPPSTTAGRLYSTWTPCSEESLCDTTQTYTQTRRAGCVATSSVEPCTTSVPGVEVSRPCSVFDCPAMPLSLPGPTDELGPSSTVLIAPTTHVVDFVGGSAADKFIVDVLADGCGEPDTPSAGSLSISTSELATWYELPDVAVVLKAGEGLLGERSTNKLMLTLPRMPAIPLTLRIRPIVPVDTTNEVKCVDSARTLVLPPLIVTSFRLFSIALVDSAGAVVHLPAPSAPSYPLRISFVGVAKTTTVPLHVPGPAVHPLFSTQLVDLDPGFVPAITLDNVQRLLEHVGQDRFPLSLSVSVTDVSAIDTRYTVGLPLGYGPDDDLQVTQGETSVDDMPEVHFFSSLSWEEVTASTLAPVVFVCDEPGSTALQPTESRCAFRSVGDVEELFDQMASGHLRAGCSELRVDQVASIRVAPSPTLPDCSTPDGFSGGFREVNTDDNSTSISPLVIAIVASLSVCACCVAAVGAGMFLLFRRRTSRAHAATKQLTSERHPREGRSRRSSTRHVRRHTSSSPDRLGYHGQNSM